jgi:hypothetical protein
VIMLLQTGACNMKVKLRETSSLFVLESETHRPFTIAYFPKFLSGGSRERAKHFAYAVKKLWNKGGRNGGHN